MTRPQQPRIDLNHGYMRFIRRNQLDRDEFDRVHEQRKSEIRERIGEPQRAQRPNVYVPPHLRKQRQEQEEQQRAAEIASRYPSRSDSSDSSQDDQECPIRKKQQDADDHVRRQVRRRIERTYPTVDDICFTLANYSIDDQVAESNEHLFTLELTLKNGEQKVIKVPRNTKAATLAKSLSREHNFDDSQCRNLRLFIEEQLSHRLARPESIPTSPVSTTSSEGGSIPFCIVHTDPAQVHPHVHTIPNIINQPEAPQAEGHEARRRGFSHDRSVVTPMTMVKTLVALATERMLLKTSGPTFLRGIEFMYAAGLAPDRLSVMMTSSHKYVLQFHSKCDIRPFAANYPNFGRVLRGIVHVREWHIKSIEFVNVAFYMRDVDNLERAIEKLGVELVLLRNCTYPGVARGDEAVKFLSALNRKKQAVVCEYGDDRLKHRIGRRAAGGHRVRRASRNGQEVVAPPAEPAIPENPPPAAAVERRPLEAHIEIREDVRPPAPPAQPPANNRIGPVLAEHMAIAERVMRERGSLAGQPIHIMAAGAAAAAYNHQRALIAARAAQELAAQEPNQPPMENQIVVGAHIYEFRAMDQPNGNEELAQRNVDHLINVLRNNAHSDLRIIVMPSPRHPEPEGAVQLNNNDPFDLRGIYHPINPGHRELPFEPVHYIAPVRAHGQPTLAPVAARPPAVLLPPVNPELLGPAEPEPAAPVPMFGDAVNEPQVQRNGEDSNDSTDREEDGEQQQQQQQEAQEPQQVIEVVDPTAQPNFAPVQAEAVDLDMLEEEAEGEEDEVMEGVVVDGQFLMNDQAVAN